VTNINIEQIIKDATNNLRLEKIRSVYPNFDEERVNSIVKSLEHLDTLAFIEECRQRKESWLLYKAQQDRASQVEAIKHLLTRVGEFSKPVTAVIEETSHDITTRILMEKYRKK
jgi:squalene cyclase